MILNDKIIFSINRACKSSHPGGRPEARREGGLGSDGAEHVIVGAHRVVVYEQFASEGFVVEQTDKKIYFGNSNIIDNFAVQKPTNNCYKDNKPLRLAARQHT